MDRLRVLTLEGNPPPFVTAMQKIQDWTAKFGYEDLDAVLDLMKPAHRRLSERDRPTAAKAKVLPIAASMRPDIGQSRHSAEQLLMAALHKTPDMPLSHPGKLQSLQLAQIADRAL
ncbi:hypothetical protein [Dechloromonas agitata]|uniref:hypothetical protein n=1 Tax=Dechloromonas agitata TaxID=73030 RepID=UPI0012FA17EE|nr:hypothetical protein [Dechloromonas agitata]